MADLKVLLTQSRSAILFIDPAGAEVCRIQHLAGREGGMAKKPSKPEQTPPRPKPPRVTMTTAGLLTLIYFVDRLGRPDEIAPDGLVFAWPEAGAILITDPDHERC